MNATAPDAGPPLSTEDVPHCPACGADGIIAYDGLPDRLHPTPGRWRHRRCERATCGTLWLDPRPTVADIGRAYEAYVTHADLGTTWPSRLARLWKREYVARQYGYPVATLPPPLGHVLWALTRLLPGYRASFDLEIRGLGPQPGKRLLDVGCGSGHHIALLRDLGWQVEGVEIDPAAVEVARSKGLTVRQGGLAEQAYPAASFDVVTLSHVVEHLHDGTGVLRECHRILKPGGVLAVATPNARGMMHEKYGASWFALDPPRHLVLFTRQSLAAIATQAGFARAEVRDTVRDENVLDYSSRLIRDTGRFDWGTRPPLASRVWSELAQILAPLRVALGRGEGDELFMIATK